MNAKVLIVVGVLCSGAVTLLVGAITGGRFNRSVEEGIAEYHKQVGIVANELIDARNRADEAVARADRIESERRNLAESLDRVNGQIAGLRTELERSKIEFDNLVGRFSSAEENSNRITGKAADDAERIREITNGLRKLVEGAPRGIAAGAK